MLNKKEKQIIEKEARETLENFGNALDKFKGSFVRSGLGGDKGYREEGEVSEVSGDFRKRMFDNAPEKDEDCIITEKAKW